MAGDGLTQLFSAAETLIHPNIVPKLYSDFNLSPTVYVEPSFSGTSVSYVDGYEGKSLRVSRATSGYAGVRLTNSRLGVNIQLPITTVGTTYEICFVGKASSSLSIYWRMYDATNSVVGTSSTCVQSTSYQRFRSRFTLSGMSGSSVLLYVQSADTFSGYYEIDEIEVRLVTVPYIGPVPFVPPSNSPVEDQAFMYDPTSSTVCVRAFDNDHARLKGSAPGFVKASSLLFQETGTVSTLHKLKRVGDSSSTIPAVETSLLGEVLGDATGSWKIIDASGSYRSRKAGLGVNQVTISEGTINLLNTSDIQKTSIYPGALDVNYSDVPITGVSIAPSSGVDEVLIIREPTFGFNVIEMWQTGRQLHYDHAVTHGLFLDINPVTQLIDFVESASGNTVLRVATNSQEALVVKDLSSVTNPGVVVYRTGAIEAIQNGGLVYFGVDEVTRAVTLSQNGTRKIVLSASEQLIALGATGTQNRVEIRPTGTVLKILGSAGQKYGSWDDTGTIGIFDGSNNQKVQIDATGAHFRSGTSVKHNNNEIVTTSSQIGSNRVVPLSITSDYDHFTRVTGSYFLVSPVSGKAHFVAQQKAVLDLNTNAGSSPGHSLACAILLPSYTGVGCPSGTLPGQVWIEMTGTTKGINFMDNSGACFDAAGTALGDKSAAATSVSSAIESKVVHRFIWFMA